MQMDLLDSLTGLPAARNAAKQKEINAVASKMAGTKVTTTHIPGATLAEKAVLMRFSSGMPGMERTDRKVTAEVKQSQGLGEHAGKWVKDRWPDEALKPVAQLITRARDYHAAVTLPFDKGLGILPGPLIEEYREKMLQFKATQAELCERFIVNAQVWVDWAVKEHNGSFDASDYPGCVRVADKWVVNVDEFRAAMEPLFYMRCEPVPVPDSGHFTNTMHSLLGTDADTVNTRVADAMVEAQRELMRRIIAPVKHMADTLAKAPKDGEKAPRFHSTLVDNIADIVKLAPKLNLSGDAAIDGFVKEVSKLTAHTAEQLKKDSSIRERTAMEAKAVLAKLSSYSL